MALGGGTYVTQNKVLPGSYINFVSAKNASAELSERGVAAIALTLDWGPVGEVFEVSSEDFQKNSFNIFGYPYTHYKLKGLRDLFRNIKTLYAYRLTDGGTKAENILAKAKYPGGRGNDLTVVVELNPASTDVAKVYDVKVILDGKEVDLQTVSSMEELSDNDFVTWKKETVLDVIAGIPLAGGTVDSPTAAEHQDFLSKIESYSFNVLGCPYIDPEINQLYSAFCKRLRDEVGVKFQTVCYKNAADYEGTVNVVSETAETEGFDNAAAIYWVTGIIAGCEVNASNLNKKYDGEFDILSNYSQSELIECIRKGEFVLHNVNGEKRVLSDINSLVSVSADKGEDFKENQTIRVIDQIANDIALLFNTKYLGVIPNNESGRVSLWSDIVSHHEALQAISAIENFKPEHVIVEQGNSKKAVTIVDNIMPTNAMAQIYMTCIIE